MTATEGRKLKVGDALRWKSDWTTGIVRQVGYAGVQVEWSDGCGTLLTFADKGTPWDEVEVLR